jgi:hypothetical protein
MKVRVDAIVLDEPLLQGKFGEIIDVANDELATLWIKRQWCVCMDEDKPKTPTRATVETPENNQAAAEKETATVRRRGRPPTVTEP